MTGTTGWAVTILALTFVQATVARAVQTLKCLLESATWHAGAHAAP